MEATRANLGAERHRHAAQLHNPFEMRHGRRYLRDMAYPLPCDIDELHRQNLRTLLACRVFGRAVCSDLGEVPRKVLDLGCGSGYWTAMCHDYFTSLRVGPVAFTGLDVAPLAADLRRQGVDWKFVQHDFRRTPLPFDDNEFDMIMVKDVSMTVTIGAQTQNLMDEALRILRPRGRLEVWETDHVVRALQPHPTPRAGQAPDHDIAGRTATFPMAPGTPFAPPLNRHFAQANAWIREALDRRRLNPNPCVRIAEIMLKEPELRDVGVRRVAIPFGLMHWERENLRRDHTKDDSADTLGLSEEGYERILRASLSSSSSDSSSATLSGLSADQYGLRHTALITVLQMIEHLEPLLKDVSGKTSVEWSHWWTALMTSVLDPASGALDGGECLEIGAWWATKVA